MQADMIQPEIYFCRKCYAEMTAINPECPKCGKKMQTQSQIKSLGKLLIILGILISLGCGLGVLASIAILLFGENNEKDALMAFSAVSFTGAGLAAGITAIAGGAWQAKHGRTSKMFVWIFFGLVILMLVVGRIFSALKG